VSSSFLFELQLIAIKVAARSHILIFAASFILASDQLLSIINIQNFYLPAMEIENTEPTVEQADENGEIIVKELAKEYLSKGAWSTIAFLYQEKDKEGNFGDAKVSLRRFQKFQGVYKQRSKFNVSSKAQAEQIMGVFKKWYEL
jgi:hypothetical protein